jgi:hypothetical protein
LLLKQNLDIFIIFVCAWFRGQVNQIISSLPFIIIFYLIFIQSINDKCEIEYECLCLLEEEENNNNNNTLSMVLIIINKPLNRMWIIHIIR